MAFSFGTDNDLGIEISIWALAYHNADAVAAIYSNNSASGHLTGRVFDYNTGAGTAYTISTTKEGDISRIADDKHVVVYTDSADGDKLKAVIFTSSGFSSALELDANACNTPTVIAVSATKALAAYRRGIDLYAVDFSISGSAPSSAGTPVDSGVNNLPRAFVPLDSERGLLCYGSGSTNAFFVVIDATSGISWGTSSSGVAVSGGTIPTKNGLVKIASEKSVANLGDQDLVVVNTSGASAPTFGAEYASGFLGYTVSLLTIDSNTLLISGQHSGDGRLESLDVDGSDNISSNGDIATFTIDQVAAMVGSTDLAAGEALIVFQDVDDTNNLHHITASGAPTPDATTDELRHLAFDADSSNLYITTNNSGTLQMVTYDLSTLSATGTASFGAATYTEIDDQDYGLHPVVEPGSDLVVYLRGRDGNDVQVQFNDLNGTAGWVDKGPGTATWGTAKFATGLHIDPMNTGSIAVTFDDDDAYLSEDRADTWTKTGDASSDLKLSAGHPTFPGELYLAGTAAGTVLFTHNFGATDSDVSGTAMGTINAIEASR